MSRAPPPVIATAPWAAFVVAMTDLGPPSGSLSFASTSIPVAPESSATVAASSTAVGATSTGVVVVVGTVVVAVEVEVVVVVVLVVGVVGGAVVVVVVVVGGGFDRGTRTLRTKFCRIVSGGSFRSTS